MRDHRAEQRGVVIIDLRRPDHRAGRKRTARQENPPLPLPLPSADRCQLRFEHQFSARFRARALAVSLCYV